MCNEQELEFPVTSGFHSQSCRSQAPLFAAPDSILKGTRQLSVAEDRDNASGQLQAQEVTLRLQGCRRRSSY